MNKAALYQRCNGVQRQDARQLLGEFSSAIKWRSNDSLLDIGCGSGDVTVDLVLPILPGNFERLVGCDLSREMVEYARDKYALPKVSFKEFNLAIDVEKQLSWKSEQFDHITSFYCIMWVRDQRTAVENLYKLLKPGGDLLVLFVAKHPVYEFYKKQSRDKRWADCMFDVDEVISPYQNLNDPVNKFKSLLEECGFVDIKVDLQEKSYTFNGLDAVRGFLTSINPFVDRVPIEERQDYIEDLVERFLDANYNVGQNDENIKLAPPYSLIAAYARKDDSH